MIMHKKRFIYFGNLIFLKSKLLYILFLLLYFELYYLGMNLGYRIVGKKFILWTLFCKNPINLYSDFLVQLNKKALLGL